MADCNICCEKLNKSNRKEIICVFCNFSTCRNCFQKYILDTIEDPNCMNCKKIFNRTFINENCTILFINTTFKKHRQDVLFNREKSMLIETQPYVELEIQKNNMMKEIDLIRIEKYKLENSIQKLNTQMNRIYSNISALTINNIFETTGSSSTDERKKFIRKCPMEDCRGFLSTRWKCGSCDNYICNKCNEQKEDNHVCDPDNVKTMELLDKDTKPCPSCGTMIFKIDGCDQMYCLDCHTAFSWKSGRIEKGVIHNPHYYDFIRKNGGTVPRAPGDIPCGGVPAVYDIRRGLYSISHEMCEIYIQFHRTLTHIQYVELPHIEYINGNRDLRVDYLLNRITEEQFKITLQQREKHKNKKKDFRNIFQMFVDVGFDLIRQALTCLNVSDLKNSVILIDNLIIYVNDNLKQIGKLYKCVYPGIDNYNYIQNYEKQNK